MQLAATIEGITICNMWLGWQIMTFIKLQILFNLRHIFSSMILYITCPTLWQMSYQFWWLLALSARDSCLLSIFFPLFHFLWSNKKRIFFVPAISNQYNTIYIILQTCDQLIRPKQHNLIIFVFNWTFLKFTA